MITNKSKYVLVTGAGGSIGSELSLQLINIGKNNLLLIDQSEENIFYLKEKINKINKQNKIKIKYKFLLATITDKKILNQEFKKYSFSSVFHTAAYKHVNLLETNKSNAFYNNIIGTKVLLDSLKNKCEQFIYVSTDKAVYPANVMGYTKRASEILLLNEKYDFKKNIVRFGNVLNSSGSVIPIFEKQIKNKQTLTLTDKKATRYFMSIQDAVNLLINSTKLNNNNKIYVLDMGDPIKIIDLANNMIKIAGYKSVNKKPNEGEIQIKVIGLRKGEKLKEKLTYNTLKKTKIKKILLANEKINFKIQNDKIQILINDFFKNNSTYTINKLKNLIDATS